MRRHEDTMQWAGWACWWGKRPTPSKFGWGSRLTARRYCVRRERHWAYEFEQPRLGGPSRRPMATNPCGGRSGARRGGVAVHQQLGRVRHEHGGAHAYPTSTRLVGVPLGGGLSPPCGAEPLGNDAGSGWSHPQVVDPPISQYGAHARLSRARGLYFGPSAPLGVPVSI